MTAKAQKQRRPKDVNQRARLVVDLATGEDGDVDVRASQKDPAAVSLGRRGGIKGGRVRAERLSPEQRKKIAQQAAQARWKKDDS